MNYRALLILSCQFEQRWLMTDKQSDYDKAVLYLEQAKAAPR